MACKIIHLLIYNARRLVKYDIGKDICFMILKGSLPCFRHCYLSSSLRRGRKRNNHIFAMASSKTTAYRTLLVLVFADKQ